MDLQLNRADFDDLVDEFVAEKAQQVGVRISKYSAYGQLEETKDSQYRKWVSLIKQIII